MKALTGAVLGLIALFTATPAFAWGEPGHQVIGSLAEQILAKEHPDVANQVQQLLGNFDLTLATTWADCARDVHKGADGNFSYYTSKYTPAVCSSFPQDEHARMIDYASRNWDECIYTTTEGCLGTYHFADVAYQHGTYDRSFVGTSDHDIVSAINAAIVVLQGGAAPAPFLIANKREALLLIAHFVGDLHQPLHVGAVYLDANGGVVDPDAMGLSINTCDGTAKAPCTTGGNSIAITSSNNLHHSWDTIAKELGTSASADMVNDAEAVSPTTGPVLNWAAQWASETVGEANSSAFQGLTFSGNGDSASPKWTVQFADKDAYSSMRNDEQRKQLVKAGARLAQLLAAVVSTTPQ